MFLAFAAMSVACTDRMYPEDDIPAGISFYFDCGGFPETKAKIDSAGVARFNDVDILGV